MTDHRAAVGASDSRDSPRDDAQPRLRVVPLELAEANAYVAHLHRHHRPTVGHRFSLGVVTEDGTLVGVCIVGRPVAGNRIVDGNRTVLEVTRLCTDGAPNACSALYGAAARAGKAMGYQRIQTYTLPSEGGTSLRASGWFNEGEAGGQPWTTATRQRADSHPLGAKWRWVKPLNDATPPLRFPDGIDLDVGQLNIFGEAS